MTNRVLLSGSRISVSLPGVDVLAPPDYTSQFLAIDSSFGPPERVVQSGLVYVPANTSVAVYFPAQPAIPFLFYALCSGLSVYGQRWTQIGGSLYGSGGEPACFTDHFVVPNSIGGGLSTLPFNFVYSVLKP